MQHKSQHWVARSYLAAWCDPDKPEKYNDYVWVYSRDGSRCRKKAPENIFKETEMYTIKLPDGGRDLRIEHGLHELEDHFIRIRDAILEPRMPMTDEDRLKFLAFVAAMKARTKRQRDHQRKQWTEALEMGQRLRDAMMRMTPKQRAAAGKVSSGGTGPSLSMNQVEQLARNPLQNLLPAHVEALLAKLLAMKLAVLCAEDDPGFITSDDPCQIRDPQASSRPFPFNAPDLVYDTAELTMPISPTRLLVVSWRDALSGYIDVTSDLVTEGNRMTRWHCEEEFIVRRQTLRKDWFQPDQAPMPAS
jgi:hypothetical protein